MSQTSYIIDDYQYLNITKLMLGIAAADTSKDNLLNQIINDTIDEAYDYTHNANFIGLGPTIVKMVVIKYNRLGTQGVDSEGFSGVSYNYSVDYPESIMRSLRSRRKAVIV